ncbi:MAG: hypothetical protein ACRCTY_04865 [Candidatus Adiutrix sp.]
MKKFWRFALFFLILAFFAPLSACVVGDEQYEEARLARDTHRRELQDLHLANDQLNQTIGEAYSDYEALSAKIAGGAGL